MTFTINFHIDEEGYSVWCPELPGCWSQGDSLVEALGNINDAITEYLTAKYLYLH